MTFTLPSCVRRFVAVALMTALAITLLPAMASAGTLDQSQTDTSGEAPSIAVTDTAYQSLAQTFTAGLSGQLDQVDLYLGGCCSPITIEIRDIDSSGYPGSNVLARSSLTGVNSEAWYSVSFATPASVMAGTQYAIVAYTTLDGLYGWTVSQADDPYPAGEPFVNPGTGFQVLLSGVDLAFKTYVVPTPADLSLAIVGPDTASRKSTATYILTVHNVGPGTATNAVLTDTLPYGVQLAAVTTSQGSCTPPSKDVTTVTCDLGDIANGSESNSAVTVTFKANVANSNLNFIASVTSDMGDPNLDNNTASFSTVVAK